MLRRKKTKRCSECRRWFEPAATAVNTQKVCCQDCRLIRRRRLARRRRQQNLKQYREQEAQRQRDWRGFKQEPASSEVGPPTGSDAQSSEAAQTSSPDRVQVEGCTSGAEMAAQSPAESRDLTASAASCHPPPCGDKHPEFNDKTHRVWAQKLLDVFDRRDAVSRATLRQEFCSILDGYNGKAGKQNPGRGPMSRTGLSM
jgi:hypothetical protein